MEHFAMRTPHEQLVATFALEGLFTRRT